MMGKGVNILRVIPACLCLLTLLLGGEIRAALTDIDMTWDTHRHFITYDASNDFSYFDQQESSQQVQKKKRPVRILAGEYSKFEKSKPFAVGLNSQASGDSQSYLKRWDAGSEVVFLQFVPSFVSTKRGPPC